MTIRLKIVPNMEPNADGEWIELDMLYVPPTFREVDWHVSDLLPLGHHLVQYEVVR